MLSDIAIVEVRAGVGGEEAKLWANDLFRMYSRYGERLGWKITIVDSVVLQLRGPGAYEKLIHESGVHRVQRIPSTERHGRVHTSTASVVVLPNLSENEIKVNPGDLEWQFYRASSHGGQNVQKVSTAVRLIHRPTGIVVTSERERYQEANRNIVMQLLRTKLWEREELQKETTMAGYRSVVGRGMRSEKIRTYNYPQNRITDHRLKKSFHNLEAVLNGDLEKIVSSF